MSDNNKNRFYRIVLCGMVLGLSCHKATAASFETKGEKTTVYMAIGQTEVKANELVYGQPSTYPTDYKLSHLIWQTRSAPVLTAGLNLSLSKYYTFNIESKFALKESKSIMDDYDWLYTNTSDWSHWSHHDDTILTESGSLDVNFDFNLLGKKKNMFQLLLGYKEELWAWKAHGGTYIYSTTSTNKFRDLSGSFTPGQEVIRYRQNFSMPYLGLKFNTKFNKWNFNLQYKYSNQVDVVATDHHVLRNLLFEDSYEKGKMSAFKMSAGYQLSKNFDLNVIYDVQVYKEVRGNTLYRNASTGAILGRCINCAGADNTSNTLSIGAMYHY
jgi:outer membrane protease